MEFGITETLFTKRRVRNFRRLLTVAKRNHLTKHIPSQICHRQRMKKCTVRTETSAAVDWKALVANKLAKPQTANLLSNIQIPLSQLSQKHPSNTVSLWPIIKCCHALSKKLSLLYSRNLAVKLYKSLTFQKAILEDNILKLSQV